jgi:hypothetical protein
VDFDAAMRGGPRKLDGREETSIIRIEEVDPLALCQPALRAAPMPPFFSRTTTWLFTGCFSRNLRATAALSSGDASSTTMI